MPLPLSLSLARYAIFQVQNTITAGVHVSLTPTVVHHWLQNSLLHQTVVHNDASTADEAYHAYETPVNRKPTNDGRFPTRILLHWHFPPTALTLTIYIAKHHRHIRTRLYVFGRIHCIKMCQCGKFLVRKAVDLLVKEMNNRT